ncbi:MAG: DUF481 domain-containing protein [Gammaproteobacteria bacterium]|nr:DUF481 domain-containing protein [Gammaproteobacteria bacterium]
MKKILISLLLLSFAPSAHAIVNVSDLHLTEFEPGFSGDVAATLGTLSGNSSQQQYELGTSLRWTQTTHSHFLLMDRNYGESQSTPYVDKSFTHMRNIWQRNSGFAWELFLQTEQDQFARLSARHLFGAGARFSYLFGKQGKLHLGSGLFQEQEILFDRDGTDDGGTQVLNRANIYLVLEIKLDKKLKLVSSTYLQPDLDNAVDYRLLEQASLKYQLNEAMSLKLSLDIKQDNAPPQKVKTTDSGLKLGLEYNF